MPWLELPAERPGLPQEHSSALPLFSGSQPPPQTAYLCAVLALFESLQVVWLTQYGYHLSVRVLWHGPLSRGQSPL